MKLLALLCAVLLSLAADDVSAAPLAHSAAPNCAFCQTVNLTIASETVPVFDFSSWFKDEIIGGLIDEYAPGQLNEREKELAKEHPFAALQVSWAMETANTVTKGLFGDHWNVDDTRANAFKHCLWNALMAYSIGAELARQFGEAHEYGMMQRRPESMQMDLHNNEVGYKLGTSAFTENEYSREALLRYEERYATLIRTYDFNVYVIIDRVVQALENGTLIWLKD